MANGKRAESGKRSDRDSGDTSQIIINGVLSVLAEEGIANLTTKAVSARADVSTAAIHYFFETKENLLYSTFRYMVKALRDETTEIRRKETDPLKRIARSIEVHFSPFHFVEDASILWPQLWAYSGSDAAAARLFRIFSARMIGNYTADLHEAGLDPKQARLKAVELSALTRGLWLEKRMAESVEQSECWRILEYALAAVAKETGRKAPRFRRRSE
ncbi:MAG: TetR family transcriptional regulator C-terminal domain-containing protein [Parvularculaceae bacterium]